jgi:hypothetical protein
MNFLDFILKKLEKKIKCNGKSKIDNRNTNGNSELKWSET